MISLKDLWNRLISSPEKEEIVAQKREEAHDIKNKMAKDVLRIKLKVDRIDRETSKALKDVIIDLDKVSVTYHIAVASGGKKRGLK